MFALKICIFLNILLITYGIVSITTGYVFPPQIEILQSVVGYINNVAFSLSAIITSLYGSRTLGGYENLTIFEELKHRYLNSNLKLESVRVLKELSSMRPKNVPYEELQSFKKAIRNNLLYRMNLSSMMNMLLWFFLFYNWFAYSLFYLKPTESQKIIYMTINIINPAVVLFFSYMVVLCDNVNTILVYIGLVKQSENEPIQLIQEYTRNVQQPFIYQFAD